jgi:hypothetical protein
MICYGNEQAVCGNEQAVCGEDNLKLFREVRKLCRKTIQQLKTNQKMSLRAGLKQLTEVNEQREEIRKQFVEMIEQLIEIDEQSVEIRKLCRKTIQGIRPIDLETEGHLRKDKERVR